MEHMIELHSPRLSVRVDFPAPNAARICHGEPGAGFPEERPWIKDVLLPGLPVERPELQVRLEEGQVVIASPEGRPFFQEARPVQLHQKARRLYGDIDIPKTEIRWGIRRVTEGVKLWLTVTPGESFYGWGEWFNAFQRKAGAVNLRTRDAIALLQGRETYSAIPIFLSSRGYAFFLLNSYASRWRILPEKQQIAIEADGPGADYIVIYGPGFRRIIETYTALTGRPSLPPRWAFGLFVTGYPQEHQAVVEQRVEEHRQRGIPLDSVILDYHWEERFHNFRWRHSLFPDPDGLVKRLRAKGVRLGLIQTPFVNARQRPFQKWFLNTLAGNIPPGLEKDDERDEPGYTEASQQGLLVHPRAKWWFGAGGMVDFTNPKAIQWWNARMRPLYDQGIAFFKNDDGEYTPDEAHSANGLDGPELHNIYGFYYSRALSQGMMEIDDRRPFIYARSVWAGSQRFPALFLGDQKPEFEHMRSSLRAGLNLALLGFSYWTADVFGLDGKTTPETHMRYAQYALLLPIARYFWRPPHLDNTRLPWSHSPQAEANFRRYTELRYRLLPYYYALAWEAWKTGIPMIRPLRLEFENETHLLSVDDQYMLGSRLLVAPVLEAGATGRRVVLPAGTWHDFWREHSWQGPGEIDYPASLEVLPLLVRGGTLLPMGPVMQHISDTHTFSEIEWHAWGPWPAEGLLYEDDGLTRAYQNGASSLVHLRLEEDDQGKRVLQVSAAQGDYLNQPATRRVRLTLHGLPAGAVISQEIQAGLAGGSYLIPDA
jgi:alpha-glucosidase (family GH31 glycosyl hydrolase)